MPRNEVATHKRKQLVVLAATSVTVAVTTGIQLLRQSRALADSESVVQSGIDFLLIVWAPIRGLAAGLNPYGSPVPTAYVELTGAPLPSGIHPPSLLVLASPLALPSVDTGYLLSVVVTCGLLWAALIIGARPRQIRQWTAVLVLGSLVVLSGPADFLLGLGQVTAWAALGTSLLLRYPSSWVGALGLSLVLVVPQVGVLLSVFLLVMGRTRVALRGWGIMAVLSAPVLSAAVVNAGGPTSFVSGVLESLRYSSGEANSANRLDVAGGLADLGATGPWVSVLVVILLAIVLRLRRPALDEVTMVAMVAVTSLSTYQMPYHVPLLLTTAAIAAVATAVPLTIRLMSITAIVAGGLTSFSLLWVRPDSESSPVGYVLQPLLMFTLLVAPVALALGSGIHIARSSSTRLPPAAAPTAAASG